MDIPGYDLCACCGTHVRRTGEVGQIKILSWVKFHQGIRMEMVCGGRALQYLSGVLEENTKVSRMLSAKPMETAAAVERQQKELYRLTGRVAALEESEFRR